MNTRDFSYELEFGNQETDDALPATAPTDFFGRDEHIHEPTDEMWQPEVMQLDSVEPEGNKRIGTEESWIELAWNLQHRLVWLTLYMAEGNTPISAGKDG